VKLLRSVALISRSNALGGGASRIAEELAEWLQNAKLYVRHYIASPVGKLKAFQLCLHHGGRLGRWSRCVQRFTSRLGMRELIPFEFWTTLQAPLDDFDLIHFHDLNRAITPLTLALTARRKPVVFTAHDCSCFTGGCVYPMGCDRFEQWCGECPQLATLGARFDFTRTNLRINRWVARKRRVQYVFPSEWLSRVAARSVSLGRRAEVIPNGFRSDQYEFREKAVAKEKLAIAKDTPVIAVAAHYLSDPRKGIQYSLAAIRAVADLNPLVLFIGLPPDDLETQIPGVRFWQTGFVQDRVRLGLLLSAADLFLFTSIEDNLPIMVQEAMAAGTPVVGFGAGGLPEMVDHGRTGWLCAAGQQGELNFLLRRSLSSGSLGDVGRAAQSVVRTRFSFDDFGERHLALYRQLLD
jgi:glycosyltransferase involved in cell wall biosynthesis